MTGLRTYERDRLLPARAGDVDLCPPTPESMLELVREHLSRGSGSAPISADWLYARWKPHVAFTASYRVRLADQSEHQVTWKRHAGAKFERVEDASAVSNDASRGPGGGAAWLASDFVLPDGRTHLFTFPTDRALPGLSRVLDLRRTCRFLGRSGPFGTAQARWRRSRAEVLRYKPERRAVLRLEVVTRDAHEDLSSQKFVARVLEPSAAARATSVRRAIEELAGDVCPRWIASEPRTGILFEEHLEVAPLAWDDFACAREAGLLLARLHAFAAPWPPDRGRGDLEHVMPLFEADERLWIKARSLGPLVTAPDRAAYVHGDFHPDQLARAKASGVLRLLDWDSSWVGDPLDDLASWIADAIAHQDSPDWEAASGDLLGGYAAGRAARVEQAPLRTRVARELVQRAAAALRRSESRAVDKAERVLTLAEEVLGTATRPREETPFEAAQRALSSLAGAGARASIRRTEAREDGEIVITTQTATAERWFTTRGGRLSEIEPRDEDALPGASVLAQACEAGAGTVLAWRPGRRMVVLVRDPRGDRVVKALRPGRSRHLERLHRAVQAQLGAGEIRVPRLAGADHALETLTFEFVPGRELEFADTACFARLGHGVARLPGLTPAVDLPLHAPDDELAVIDRAARRYQRVERELPAGFEALRARLPERRASELGDLGFAHRDLHDGQFLLDERGFVLLDLDLAARAERELDVANLLVHFELCALRGSRGATATSVRAAEAAFLAGHGTRLDAERLAWYRATTALRLALVFALRPRLAQVVPELLASARRCLEPVPRA